MGRKRVENPWLVVGTCVLAIIGVVMIRVGLRLDFRYWPVAYLAMGLTASIRRTSEGSDCTTCSAIRGIVCMLAGLYATEWLGCPGTSYHSVALVPGEFLEAIADIRDGIARAHP